jgi:hypothetical protein
MTKIDGLDIHFIHVRSKHENALPLIVTHGWPGSIIEQTEDHRSTDQSHGAWRERIGRFPSGDSVDAGLRVFRQADNDRLESGPHRRAWVEADGATWIYALCGARRRLGCIYFTDAMAEQAPPGLLGIHTNYPGTVPTDIGKALKPAIRHQPASRPMSCAHTSRCRPIKSEALRLRHRDGNRPQTLTGLADSPGRPGGLDD